MPPNARKLNHLCDLEFITQVEHGQLDLFVGSDYFEKLLLPLEFGIGKPQEPVGVDTRRMDICWTYLGGSKRVSVANHVYTFHASLRASDFIRKMWDDEVVESLIETSP